MGRKSKTTKNTNTAMLFDLFTDFQMAAENILRHYFISPFDNIERFDNEQRFDNNLSALRLLKELTAGNRVPTQSEQRTLSLYSGWGSLAATFEHYNTWATTSTHIAWRNRQEELKKILSESEYAALRKSITTAYYTPSWLIQRLWAAVERLGFRGGRILEPAMGTGRFLGYMPEPFVRNSQITGIELEPFSGSIAKHLFPESKIHITGFENATLPDQYFDLVITNVPFGDFKVYDPAYNKFNLNIHNYFMLKSIDKLSPGGLGIFITSLGTMQSDTQGATIRSLLAERANLVSAVRLPEKAFAVSGTDTATDILIFQKKSPTSFQGESWTELASIDVNYAERTERKEVSEYFINHPENVLGQHTINGRFHTLTLRPEQNLDLHVAFKKWVDSLPENIVDNLAVEPRQTTQNQKLTRHEGFAINAAGMVCQRMHDEEIPLATSDKQYYRIRAMIKLRDLAKSLLQAEWENDNEQYLEKLRQELNIEYDRFVTSYGLLQARANQKAFIGDAGHGLLLSLETAQGQKAAIFHKRTINPFYKPEKVDSAFDALLASLHEYGYVNLSRMQELTQSSEEDLLAELQGKIYRDPINRKWTTADDYLSGYVKDKLAIALKAAEDDARYNANVEALTLVQPDDLTYEEIDARLGAPWIPASDISDFANHILSTPKDVKPVEVKHFPSICQWEVCQAGYSHATAVANTQTWGTTHRSAMELLGCALNQQVPTVKDTVYDTTRKRDIQVVNEKETLAARHQLERIKEEFKSWIWADPSRRQRLSGIYNATYNNYRLRTYDGSHLTFPGLSKELSLRPHQKNSVWRILQTRGSTLLAHMVGAGKTYSMQAAGMELRRLNLANRLLYSIPTANFDDFVTMFRMAYPLANVLVLTGEDLPPAAVKRGKNETEEAFIERQELTSARRAATVNRIMTGDWDAIVVTHEIFRRIGVRPETEEEFIQHQIDDLETAIIEAELQKGTTDNKRIVKRLESAKARLEERLLSDLNKSNRTIDVCFEDLHIDALFVDEADMFKNLSFATHMSNVAGIQNTGSERAMDMFLKVRTLAKEKKRVIFATATPISNTLAEMYTMMRYLCLDELNRRGAAHFDAWAGSFGEVVTSLERTPDGQSWRPVSRFANIINAPELITLFRSFADVLLAEDLDLPRPSLKNNERIIVAAEPSADLKDYVHINIMSRVKAIQNGTVKPHQDNMLKITGDMRKASLDIRLVLPYVKPEGKSKIDMLVDNAYSIWHETIETRKTQVIFCDLSIPKPAVKAETPEDEEDCFSFSVYQEIRKRLIEKGVTPEEVAFIHDAKNDRQKAELKAKVRAGIVRILLGSTVKLGVGVNIQDKLIALHHLDCPWRPRDVEQREGRILRQGNGNKEVMIFAYVTEQSADSWLWQTIKSKAKFIAQAMSGKLSASRTLSDLEQTVLSYAQIEAIATGNPLLMEKFKVDSDVEKFQMLKSKWQSDRLLMQDELLYIPGQIATLQRQLQNAEEDIRLRNSFQNSPFSITLGEYTYHDAKQASMALRKACEAILDNHTPACPSKYAIGAYRGFALYLHVDEGFATIKTSLSLEHKSSYQAGMTLHKLNDALETQLDEYHFSLQQKISGLRQKTNDLRKQLQCTFEYEERLKTALQRQQEISAILNPPDTEALAA